MDQDLHNLIRHPVSSSHATARGVSSLAQGHLSGIRPIENGASADSYTPRLCQLHDFSLYSFPSKHREIRVNKHFLGLWRCCLFCIFSSPLCNNQAVLTTRQRGTVAASRVRLSEVCGGEEKKKKIRKDSITFSPLDRRHIWDFITFSPGKSSI